MIEFNFVEYARDRCSDAVFDRGRKMAVQGAVKDISLEDEELGKITACVKGSQNDEYVVDIYLMGDSIYNLDIASNCSCPFNTSYSGLCKHRVAVFLKLFQIVVYDDKLDKFIDKRKTNSFGAYKFETTYELAKNLIQGSDEYFDFTNVCSISPESLKLIPQIVVNTHSYKPDMYLKFRIGTDKTYLVKSFESFVDAVINKKFFEYGKNLAFTHNIELFDERSKRLFWIIYNHVASKSWIRLDMAIMTCAYDELNAILDLYLNDNININGSYAAVKQNNPNIKVDIQAVYSSDTTDLDNDLSKNDKLIGAKLISKKCCYILKGKTSWIYQDGYIYKCDENYALNVFPVLEKVGLLAPPSEEFINIKKTSQQTEENDDPIKYEANLSIDDFDKFAYFVLPDLEKNNIIHSCDINFSSYKPAEPTFNFYISYDKNADFYWINPRVSYDEKELKLLEVNDTLRDLKKENKAVNIINKYFHFDGCKYHEYYEIVGAWPDQGYCEDPDDIFELFVNGLEELADIGNIYTDEDWQELKIKPTADIDIDLSLSNNLIDFRASSDTFTDSEIVEILKHFNLDKKYFVNDKGEYVLVNNKQIKILSEIVSALDIDGKNLVHAKVPSFRALYLNDKILDSDSGLRVKRNKLFKEVINKIKSFKNLDIDVPKIVNAQIRGYQKDGYRWLSALYECGLGGILADDMGLGKTLQTICVIANIIQNAKANKLSAIPRFLIVCPASLVYNWEDEFNKFANSIKLSLVIGTALQREDAITNEADVYISSYNSLSRDISLYEHRFFNICILDEAQYIKNSTTKVAKSVKAIQSSNKFALTGTPIENNIKDLWSIFDFLMPGYLYSKTKFSRDFVNPIEKGDDVKLSEIARIVSPFILRRIKKDVLAELPEKIENIQFVNLEKQQRRLYDAHVQLLRNNILQTSNKEFKTKAIKFLAMLTKLRQICCSPELLSEDDTPEDVESAKIEATIELLSDCFDTGHKVLVFSQFTSMLEILQQKLQDCIPHAKYLYLCGSDSKEKRRQMVNKFQNGNVDVFFVSLRAGGTGLNLTKADRVIHVDPWWNYAAEQQATDRAHRIGQKNSVYVTKLVAKDTIEEKIIKLQEKKKTLAESIVSCDSASAVKFNKEELLELLK